MSAIVVIPARFQSSRYPGKPLVQLQDRHGTSRSLIEWSWLAACRIKGIDAVYVATDDDRIRSCAEQFGANVIMTSLKCQNGTERCAEAVSFLENKPKIVVNLQGDAPLTPPWFAEELILGLRTRPEFSVATPVLSCDAESYARFREDRRAGRVGATTVTFDNSQKALYFSKEIIPFLGDQHKHRAIFHHVGVYAYTADALERYKKWSAGKLELLEGLEQLRFLEQGEPILCVEVQSRGRSFWELNNPEDRNRVEDAL